MNKKHNEALTATWYEGYDVGHKDGYDDGRDEMGFESGRKLGYGQGVAHALTASSIAIIGGTLIWVLVNA